MREIVYEAIKAVNEGQMAYCKFFSANDTGLTGGHQAGIYVAKPAVFDANKISYSAQAKTEGNKKPDFIFPSIVEYHNVSFDFMGLTYLGAKTTCKDRWRQILNEANRIPDKHLFTLQQGISPQQLDEMKDERVHLVVPQEYIQTYPKDKRNMIINFQQFLLLVKEKERKTWI